MVEQRTLIDNVLHSILIHPEMSIDKTQEIILAPVEFEEVYFAEVPNCTSHKIRVEKDSEIKVIHSNRGEQAW